MSCEYREIFLEAKYEEGLAKGLSEEEAVAYALQCAEESE
tara:strand:+ start:1171 stop:1290 length:120 start_codon:yes stop_codon:yes gene_type:complete